MDVRFAFAPLPVLHLLLELALLGAVVLDAALRRTPLAMRLLAPKRTTQVVTSGITWMGQKENPAMPATGQAGPQARLGP